MFPEEKEVLELSEAEPGTGKVIGFDYTMKDIPVSDGRIVLYDELESVKQWIMKQIQTEKDRYIVYEGVDFGITSLKELITSLKELITSDFPELFIKSQVENDITERLLEHPAITDVSEFEFSKNKRTWKVKFTAYTIYGIVEEAVVL